MSLVEQLAARKKRLNHLADDAAVVDKRNEVQVGRANEQQQTQHNTKHARRDPHSSAPTRKTIAV